MPVPTRGWVATVSWIRVSGIGRGGGIVPAAKASSAKFLRSPSSLRASACTVNDAAPHAYHKLLFRRQGASLNQARHTHTSKPDPLFGGDGMANVQEQERQGERQEAGGLARMVWGHKEADDKAAKLQQSKSSDAKDDGASLRYQEAKSRVMKHIFGGSAPAPAAEAQHSFVQQHSNGTPAVDTAVEPKPAPTSQPLLASILSQDSARESTHASSAATVQASPAKAHEDVAASGPGAAQDAGHEREAPEHVDAVQGAEGREAARGWQEAQPNGGHDSAGWLFVANLAPNTTEEVLRRHFSVWGSCKITEFHNSDDAARCVSTVKERLSGNLSNITVKLLDSGHVSPEELQVLLASDKNERKNENKRTMTQADSAHATKRTPAVSKGPDPIASGAGAAYSQLLEADVEAAKGTDQPAAAASSSVCGLFASIPWQDTAVEPKPAPTSQPLLASILSQDSARESTHASSAATVQASPAKAHEDVAASGPGAAQDAGHEREARAPGGGAAAADKGRQEKQEQRAAGGEQFAKETQKFREIRISGICNGVTKDEVKKLIESVPSLKPIWRSWKMDKVTPPADSSHDFDANASQVFTCAFPKYEMVDAAIASLDGASLGSGKIKVTSVVSQEEREVLMAHMREVRREKRERQKMPVELSVFVGNIPVIISKAVIRKHFESAGQVENVAIPMHRIAMVGGSMDDEKALGGHNGYCFVGFQSAHEVQKAIATLDGTMLEGQQLHVKARLASKDEAGSDAHDGGQGSDADAGAEVYVGGLAPSTTTQSLVDFFSQAGRVKRVRGPLYRNANAVKGHEYYYGFVTFFEMQGALLAIETLNGQSLDGMSLVLRLRTMNDKDRKAGVASKPKDDNDVASSEVGKLTKADVGQVGADFSGSSPYAGLIEEERHEAASTQQPQPAAATAPTGQAGLLSMITWDAKMKEAQKQAHASVAMQQPSAGEAEADALDPHVHVHGGRSKGEVETEGQQQSHSASAEARACEVYVGGLPCDFNSAKLRGVFEAVGKVERAHMQKDPQHNNHRSKGYGFVTFDRPEDAERAIEMMNGKDVHGSPIVVRSRTVKGHKAAVPSSARDPSGAAQHMGRPEDSRVVYVNNMAYDTTEQKLLDLFQSGGLKVENISLPWESVLAADGSKVWQPKGFAFITFEEASSVQKAIDMFDGYNVHGRSLSVNMRTTDPAERDRVRQRNAERERERLKKDALLKERDRKDDEKRQVYVSRFPINTTKDWLENKFAAAGEIEAVHMPTVMTSTNDGSVRMAKGWAFVTFKHIESVDAAVQMDGDLLGGNRIQVKRRVLADKQEEQQASARVGSPSKADKVRYRDYPDGLDVQALQRQYLEEQAVRDADDRGRAEAPERENERELEQAAAAGQPSAAAEEDEHGVVEQSNEARGPEREPQAPVPQPKRSGRQSKQRKQLDAKEIKIQEGMTIKELSELLGVRLVDVIKCLIRLGEDPKTILHTLSIESAEFVVGEFGARAVLPEGAESTALGRKFSDEEYVVLPRRPPIVTIMGHVDHGKTTLLDYLRSSSIAAGEAGGITQRIAAFEVERPGLGKICFVDTPGHQAFSAMRERGAKATDIVILVVSAIDGVQPQTIEVIQHARVAQVPIVIAVNKCDLPEADPQRILQELTAEGVVVEELGGDVQSVNISGKTGLGVDRLEESVLLLSEMMELRAPADGPGEGFVVEVRKDKALGPVASVIVTLGQLNKGDYVVVGSEWGRVRTMTDGSRNQLDSVGPASVCDVTGFRGQPQAGQELYVVESEKAAVAHSERIKARKERSEAAHVPLAQGSSGEGGEGKLDLPLVVKCDVDGSLEALATAINQLPNREVTVSIVHADIGPCTEHDVGVAEAAGAQIFTFNCKEPTGAVVKSAKQKKVQIHSSKIIYRILEQIEACMLELLPPETRVDVLGEANVQQIFEIKVKGGVSSIVAGCKVTSGVMKSGVQAQVVRNGEVVFEGQMASLRNHKEVVKQISSGSECGMVLQDFDQYQKGDTIICIEKVVVKRTSLAR